MTIRVEVTAEDIACGQRGKCRWCPVALALSHATGLTWDVAGDGAQNAEGGRIGFDFEVSCWILEYDRGGTVLPFAFDVDDGVPQP